MTIGQLKPVALLYTSVYWELKLKNMKSNLLAMALLAMPFLTSAQTNNYANGATVANFTVTDVEGVTHTLYNYTSSGKYVVLDFFFDTCGPCQATAPYFNEVHETYGCNDGDLICLTVNNGTDSDAEVIAYENTYGGSFNHSPAVSSTGGGGAVTSTFGVSAFPTYCLIGPNNTMIVNDIWPISNMSTFVAAFPAGSNITPTACAVGIDENDVVSFTGVYPVPSQGIITLNVSSRSSSNVTVEVVDVLGQLVATHSFNGRNGSSTQTLDLSNLSDGQYFLKLNAGNQTADTQRIVIAH